MRFKSTLCPRFLFLLKLLPLLIFLPSLLFAQSPDNDTIRLTLQKEQVRIAIVKPRAITGSSQSPIPVVYYALPNGSTIEQTMGRVPQDSASWKDGIQRIEAQSHWLRQNSNLQNLVVVYLEAALLAWPAWKRDNINNYREMILSIDSTIKSTLNLASYYIMLNGHSGGGRFIFSYLDAFDGAPKDVRRISFIDSNYGYEFKYREPIERFIRDGGVVTVFAYNDSIALYNGKPFVSDTGGTWYRSFMMLHDFEQGWKFTKKEDSGLIHYTSEQGNIFFVFKTNPDRGIYHTEQVALNGFIHSLLAGTPYHEKSYKYFSSPVYK